jgi:hypothetical protein
MPMGRVYAFICPHCQYRANVSGGTEQGYHCVTQTIVCLDCKTLHDVSLRVRVPEKSPGPKRLLPDPSAHLPPMLLFGQPPRTQWLKLTPRCPAFPGHRIAPWTAPGKCPRCGIYLERAALPYRIWE